MLPPEWSIEVEGRPGQTGLKVQSLPPPRNARVSIEQNGATLRVLNLTKEDFGNYTITVTDDAGRHASAPSNRDRERSRTQSVNPSSL
uniref:Immunoglobulin I-set domain-containing protein n=1 Tax=Anguilla anguilla TaxID=7936 RepID=A0A0E9TQD0_ANGAN